MSDDTCDRWPSDCFCDGIRECIATLRQQEPLRNDQWVKGYHAALFDVENRTNLT